MIKILPGNGCYELVTPYDSGFVADLKALIPYSQRTYNRDRKTWTIGARYGQTAQDLCQKYFGRTPELPATSGAMTRLGLITVYYVG
ncbi:MAG: hypothetical protein IKS81_04365, partial [Verrucomicrobia bacterium]|nr:hypothetical protein [Verrucomicrobiota bacterium]